VLFKKPTIYIGLQAISDHDHNLQGLNLLDIPALKVKDDILLWEILSKINLTHLALEYHLLISEFEAAKKKC